MRKTVIRHYGPRAYADHPPFHYPAYKSTVKRNPDQDLLRIVQTLTESTGPGPIWTEITGEDSDLTTNAGKGGHAIGERIIVTGRVLDENGTGVPNTILEVWQANSVVLATGGFNLPKVPAVADDVPRGVESVTAPWGG